MEEEQPCLAQFRKRLISAIENVEYPVLPSLQCTRPIYRHHAGTMYTKHSPGHKQVCPVDLSLAPKGEPLCAPPVSRAQASTDMLENQLHM